MKGDVIYTIRSLRKKERDFITMQTKNLQHRIIWQQFMDGFPSYRHYGIDVGDGSVIHFRGRLYLISAEAWIQRTSMRSFLGGNKLEIEKDIKYGFPREEVILRALSKVGTDFGGYNFIFNNCEHFAYWCATDRKLSKQVLFR